MATTGQFIALRSHWRLALMLAGAVGFVVLATWLIVADIAYGWRWWLVAAGIPFFALVAAMIAMQLFATGPELVVDAQGIMWRRWTGATVPWSAIASIGELSIQRQQMLMLTLHDPARYPLAGLLGKLQGANKRMFGGDVFLTTTGTDRRFTDLRDAVARFAPASAFGGQ